MADFLSPEWIEALAQAAQASEEVTEATAAVVLTVQHVVTGTPAGEVRYWMSIDSGAIAAGPGDAARPDITFTEDYATAAGLCRGDISAHSAFLAGRVRVRGNVASLLEHRGALARLDRAFAGVRPDTEYPA